MSNALLTRAWNVRGLVPAEKLVLARLADFADSNGIAFPSHKRLAEDCALSERHLQRVIDALTKKRHVSIKATGKRAAKGRSRFDYSIHPTPDTVSTVTPDMVSNDTGHGVARHRTFETRPNKGNRNEPSRGEKAPSEMQDWQLEKDEERLRRQIERLTNASKQDPQLLAVKRARLLALKEEAKRRGIKLNGESGRNEGTANEGGDNEYANAALRGDRPQAQAASYNGGNNDPEHLKQQAEAFRRETVAAIEQR